MGGQKVSQANIKQNDPEDVKLWDPKGFLWMSIVFSFIPAAILFFLNYIRLRLIRRAYTVLSLASIIFVVAVAMALYLPPNVNRFGLFGLNIGMATYMYASQLRIYEQHLTQGGMTASFVIPVLLAIIFSALVIWAINIT